ncbi:MAG TPA: TAXI family TRAP transporter solute-binding subunit [Burkholderiales bacterium]|nr:TAXI family TRAP transporter solute-binding subunit [Burkholderiales bacterium]
MKNPLRYRFRFRDLNLRDMLAVAIPAVALIAGGFWLAAQFIRPEPPNFLIMSTGAPGGAYEAFAARYKPHLAAQGIALRERPSAGAVENLRRLLDPKEDVDVGLLQGGIGAGVEAEGLVSLGSFYHEPLWVFYRGGEIIDQLVRLKGKRLAVGGEGSGTRRLALDLLEASGVPQADPGTKFLPVGGLEAVQALAQGKLDAVFLVGPARSGAVWTALYTPGVRLMSLVHADAYSRRFPFLARLVLPRGGIDLQRDIPAADVELVAPMATIVARDSTHPALIDLLLQAAVQTHGGPGLFQRPGEFPNARAVDFPLSKEADRFYKSGTRLFQRYMPFWLATLIERTLVLLIPLVAIVLPVMRFAPALYGWRARSRVYKWYGQLKFLERELDEDPDARPRADWLAELERIEEHVHRVATPLAFANLLYTLREHIALVEAKVLKKTREDPPAAA